MFIIYISMRNKKNTQSLQNRLTKQYPDLPITQWLSQNHQQWLTQEDSYLSHRKILDSFNNFVKGLKQEIKNIQRQLTSTKNFYENKLLEGIKIKEKQVKQIEQYCTEQQRRLKQKQEQLQHKCQQEKKDYVLQINTLEKQKKQLLSHIESLSQEHFTLILKFNQSGKKMQSQPLPQPLPQPQPKLKPEPQPFYLNENAVNIKILKKGWKCQSCAEFKQVKKFHPENFRKVSNHVEVNRRRFYSEFKKRSEIFSLSSENQHQISKPSIHASIYSLRERI